MPAPPAEVYRMLTRSTHLREWLADQALAHPHVGGLLCLAWNDGNAVTGRFTRLEPARRLGLSWREVDVDATTRVRIDLEGSSDGTIVSVTHGGFGDGKRERRRADRAGAAWAASLENLASVMTHGVDLRVARRPMLGIGLDREVDPERATALGLPVDHGVEVSGVVEGMGAAAAGLRAGDVLVSIDGTPLSGWASIGAILARHRAGDAVGVEVVRDGAVAPLEMVLSARPIPEVPATAADLADFVRNLYAEVDAELAACFEGVPDEAAGRKPAPDAWSAKEVVAHLLDGEGDQHAWFVELVDGAERTYDVYPANSDLRVAVTAWSYPTMAGMLRALHRLEDQTVGILEQLPEDFVARRSSFWRLAYGYTQARAHYQEHFHQIRSALAAS
ncbi:MAG: SRPBCC domain-containing protein [Acidimicrobiia bacterium]